MKLLFLTLALIAGADFLESAVRLSGASCAEDLSQSEIERYESLAAHPLDLNGATRRELLASGLFSAYQVATILDYIAGNGEICSIAELGTVDGIGPERARDLAPFVLLEPAGRLGARPRKRLRADSMVRLADKSGTWSNAAKASASYGGFKAGLGAKDLSPTAGYLSWSGRRIVGQLTVGDFSARFGQGLLTWTGFTMTTLYTVGAFARSGTGISGSNTLSAGSAKRGMAADFQLGPVDLWAYATLDGEQMVHVQHISRRATVGATVLHDLAGFACSADWRFTLGKFTAFGESAINIVIPDSDRVSLSTRAGLFYNHSYGNRAALLLRYSSDERAAALGGENRWASLTAEASQNLSKQTRQLRTVALCNPSFSFGAWTLKPSFRLNSRYRPDEELEWRSDLRAELEIQGGPWLLHGRYNALRCENWAWLSYLEAGYKNEKTALYLRGTLFKVDNWNDRIYSYERDAPGSFNVPAYYGRGYALALYVRRRSLALRAATTRYPWTPDKKPKFELKLQLNIRI
ncbi:MAG: hypothetical protein J6X39_04835 [Bacteroidales bacterium]|nr:hypothetical protein [Bacteroidales bacterium]